MMTVVAARALTDDDRLLRRHRPAQHGRQPGPAAPTRRAPVLVYESGHDRRQAATGCRSRSATASWPRPPTRWSPCRRSSTTGCRPAASTSGFLGAAQIDRFAQHQHHGDRRLRRARRSGCPAPAARRRSPRMAGEVIVIIRQSTAHLRRAARLRLLGRLRRRAGRPRAARAAGRGPDGGDHRPRRPAARPGELRADADPGASRRDRRSRRARRPAGSCAWPTTLERDRAADRRGAERAAGAAGHPARTAA